ncbi:hypothetical protein GTP46_00520 [Duganella sp. FT135W]|uniref:DUF2306 domain-containing protein n=1 Tax=Duganella flavida TaxID=2692175 RepID=A0A6L8K9U0_9BURK|nr:hypothetical protein [Duganella flavida]MYM21131.1 hypothetical protein [Duganella flavida]
MIYGLTYLGVLHTLISLVAVAAAVVAFFRDKGIDPGNSLGKLYLWTTVLTCVTGFGIYQHGGFGKPHVLGIITLLVLAAAWKVKSLKVTTVLYSLTFLFHMIPAVTEASTRLPYGAPLLASAEAPELKGVTGVLLLLFLVGVTLQLRRLKALGK